MSSYNSNPTPQNEGHMRVLIARLLRENGWKVVEEPREYKVRPDLIAERGGQKLIIEIKRASEGRRDRLVPLLSQAALDAAYYSRQIANKSVPVAIVVAARIPESVAKQAQDFMKERAP